MLNVFILWHMHQPYYVNPLTKTAMMPWVRLHSVKGYFDMITLLEDYPEVKVNFNLTPVLVKQIVEITNGEVTDLWLEWSRKPAAELSHEEKALLLENFFKINWDHLIRPFPRYNELLSKRGFSISPESAREMAHEWSEQELRDLQVWYNLGWCGYRAEHYFPRLTTLKHKGRDFTEAEKNEVLDIHLEIMGLVIKKIWGFEARGQVELTTTPFYHPILPLVYDTNLAKRCMPGRNLPRRFSHPEDAGEQIRLAVEQHERVFGRKPRGLWPSEGSVAPELIPLMKEAGIEYFCTDEANLFRSLDHDPAWRGHKPDHLELFQGWSASHGGAKVNAIFRERPLSDFIGFVASKNSPEQGADYLCQHIEHIASVAPAPNKLLALILDGENAWEHFPDGGEGFLRCFYDRLSKSKSLRTVRGSDYFEQFPETKTTTTLHTGSWINSDFDIWIGDDYEENEAWNLLGATRDFLAKKIAEGGVSAEVQKKAFDAIHAAEGSDWFWWFGPDFNTDCDMLFDELFRIHLQNVHRYLGAEPPHVLSIPIQRSQSRQVAQEPRRMTTPAIDGQITSLSEWEGAGLLQAGGEKGAMFRGDRLINSIRFGYDQEFFYLAVDFVKFKPCQLRFDFIKPAFYRLLLNLTNEAPSTPAHSISMSFDGENYLPLGANCTASRDRILEAAIPINHLPWKEGDHIHFIIQALENGVELERHPDVGTIEFGLVQN
ncbi:glycoside hydrolase family 57 protein [Oscillatoria laete-virens NRMC-F 0139]|nr:glycoside hydrolase family 57 protein [Oscillatoria laete-virens]MDL5055498.1 glycoside hydrolase family 57 protein [Oscillatoria laete-virens NRMC-F 0139]